MSLVCNGKEISGLVFNGRSIAACYNGNIIWPTGDPYNPLCLPPFTIRCKFASGVTPTMGDSQTLVDASENVWDIYKNSYTWSGLFKYSRSNTDLVSVLGANSSGVITCSGMFYNCHALTTVPLFDTRACTNMSSMFNSCKALTTVPLFDTSSCTTMASMFYQCKALTTVPLFNTSSCTTMNKMFYYCKVLTTVPLFDTSSCTDIGSMFYSCINVQSGALALYQQASSQTTPPSTHSSTFRNCGSNTTTGAAELSQIPSDWK